MTHEIEAERNSSKIRSKDGFLENIKLARKMTENSSRMTEEESTLIYLNINF